MGKFAARRWSLSPDCCCRAAAITPFKRQDEQIKAAWSEVLNQYQRRADLIPNLVNTVKGYAAQEQTVLLGVTRGPGKGRLNSGDARIGQRSGGVGEVPSGPRCN